MAKERKGYVFEDKDGRIWARVTFTDEATGKRKNVKRRAENRTEAKDLLKKIIREFDDAGSKTIEADRLSFNQLADIYKKTKLVAPVYVGDRKVAGLRSHRQSGEHLKPLLAYFGRKSIKQITSSDIQKYKLHRLDTPTRFGEQRAIATVNRELALLRSIFNHARSESWIQRSPFDAKGISLISMADETKRERVLSMAEEKRLLAACEANRAITYTRQGKEITVTSQSNSLYLKSIIITALDTAMRKGELLKLQWKDVNFTLNEIEIRAFNTKTASKRIVGMTGRVKEELLKLWDLSPKRSNDLIFGLKDFKKSFATAIRLANLDNFRFHDLRHTAITRMVAAKTPTAEIMKISGHKQMTTFLRYVNQSNEVTQRSATDLEQYLAANQVKDDADNVSGMVN